MRVRSQSRLSGTRCCMLPLRLSGCGWEQRKLYQRRSNVQNPDCRSCATDRSAGLSDGPWRRESLARLGRGLHVCEQGAP
jgi:hypothetical protein